MGSTVRMSGVFLNLFWAAFLCQELRLDKVVGVTVFKSRLFSCLLGYFFILAPLSLEIFYKTRLPVARVFVFNVK